MLLGLQYGLAMGDVLSGGSPPPTAHMWMLVAVMPARLARGWLYLQTRITGRSPPKDFLRDARHHLPCPRARERLGELGGEWGLIAMAAQASEAASEAVSASAFESNNDPRVGLFTDADAVLYLSIYSATFVTENNVRHSRNRL